MFLSAILFHADGCEGACATHAPSRVQCFGKLSRARFIRKSKRRPLQAARGLDRIQKNQPQSTQRAPRGYFESPSQRGRGTDHFLCHKRHKRVCIRIIRECAPHSGAATPRTFRLEHPPGGRTASAAEKPPYVRRIAPRRGALQKRLWDRKTICGELLPAGALLFAAEDTEDTERLF